MLESIRHFWAAPHFILSKDLKSYKPRSSPKRIPASLVGFHCTVIGFRTEENSELLFPTIIYLLLEAQVNFFLQLYVIPRQSIDDHKSLFSTVIGQQYTD